MNKTKIIELKKMYENIPISELPRIWYEIGEKDKWPVEFGEKPSNFGVEGVFRCWEAEYIISKIEDDLGEKALVRYLMVKEGFTDQMFDDWWESKQLAKPRKNFKNKLTTRNRQCKYGKHSINHILSFAFGILFAKFISILIYLCS